MAGYISGQSIVLLVILALLAWPWPPGSVVGISSGSSESCGQQYVQQAGAESPPGLRECLKGAGTNPLQAVFPNEESSLALYDQARK